jgi:hypothetical protein
LKPTFPYGKSSQHLGCTVSRAKHGRQPDSGQTRQARGAGWQRLATR